MRQLFNTKLALWVFNRLFGIPKGVTIVQLSRNSIHFTEDGQTFKCRTFQRNLLDFPALKKLQTILLFPLAFVSKGFAFLLLTDTASVCNKDAGISQFTPTTNYGNSATTGYVASQTGGDDWRLLLHFTLSSGSGTISAVKLNLYKAGGFGTNTGLNLEVHELSRTNWTEAGVTWNKYDGTNNWTTAGGDFSATIVSALPHTTSNNLYRTWDIGPGATNPISGLTWGSDVHLIVRYSNTGNNPAQAERFNTDADGSNLPYIEITYTAGGGTTPPPVFFIFN